MSPASRIVFFLFVGLLLSAPALAFDAKQVNTAEPGPANKAASKKLDPLTTKIEILLVRAHYSPGEIDGKDGENVEKALKAFAQAHGGTWDGKWTPDLWQALSNGAPDNLFTEYTITEEDVRGPFSRKIPTKMENMKDLTGLYYTSPREELAERFHVSEELLRALNPGVALDKAGHTLVVPAVADRPLNE